MKINALLLALGATLIFIAGYRMGAIKLDKAFLSNLAPNAVLTLTLAAALWHTGGVASLAQGAVKGSAIFSGYAPLLLVVFFAVGEASVLAEAYKQEILDFLGGKYGIVGSLFSGTFLPSSMTGMPIVKDLWYGGADKGVLLVFLMATSLTGVQMVLFRQPMLGWTITGIYCTVAFTNAFIFAGIVYLLRPILPFLR